jgi:hypothetical protein
MQVRFVIPKWLTKKFVVLFNVTEYVQVEKLQRVVNKVLHSSAVMTEAEGPFVN